MKTVNATASLSVNSGQVKLSALQAKPRAHALRLVGKIAKDGSAVYDVIASINFKAGETFEFSGEANKAGELRDREAEALAKLETEDRIRAEVRAELEAKHAESLKTALAEQEAKLRAELAPKPAGQSTEEKK